MTTAAASEPKQSIFKLIYFIDNHKTLIVRIRKRMTIVSIQYVLTYMLIYVSFTFTPPFGTSCYIYWQKIV